MADPTRRQIAMMADEVGITDYPAADRLVRRAFEVSRSARAALAEPAPPAAGEVGEGVTDEDLGDLWSWAAAQDQGPWPTQQHCFARAVLARWGRQPAPPAEGEVAELVAWLRRQASKWDVIDREAGLTRSLVAEHFTRAADLLEQRQAAPVPAAVGEAAHIRRMCDIILGSAFGNKELDSLALLVGHHPDVLNALPAPVPAAEGEMAESALKELERTVVLLMPVTGHKKIKRFDTIRAALKRLQELENKADSSPAPVPVPVAERLPGAEDCDAEGRCWLWRTDGADEFWELVVPLSNIHEFNLTAQWKYTHWLPAHALPLPTGEVE